MGEPEGSNVPLADLFRKKYGMQAGNIVGTGTYKPDYIPPDADGHHHQRDAVLDGGRHAASRSRSIPRPATCALPRLINVADVGKPINPKIVETQLSGASLMQLGFTMFEKMHLDGGQVTNASLADYKIPGIHDVPPVMENEAVDTYQTQRPVRRQGRRRTRHVRRVAGDRQCHRRRRRRAAHRIAADRGGGVPRAARQGRQAARG